MPARRASAYLNAFDYGLIIALHFPLDGRTARRAAEARRAKASSPPPARRRGLFKMPSSFAASRKALLISRAGLIADADAAAARPRRAE